MAKKKIKSLPDNETAWIAVRAVAEAAFAYEQAKKQGGVLSYEDSWLLSELHQAFKDYAEMKREKMEQAYIAQQAESLADSYREAKLRGFKPAVVSLSQSSENPFGDSEYNDRYRHPPASERLFQEVDHQGASEAAAESIAEAENLDQRTVNNYRAKLKAGEISFSLRKMYEDYVGPKAEYFEAILVRVLGLEESLSKFTADGLDDVRRTELSARK